MNNRTLRVLSIEDNPDDAHLIRIMLAEARELGWDLPRFDLEQVTTLSAALERMEPAPDRIPVDAILSDLDLPDSQAQDTFARLHAHAPQIPIVVLTGREDEELAITTVRAGAEDYLFKREMSGSLLAHALLYAVERQRAKAALHKAHDELEIRVGERTAELARANKKLQNQIAARRRVEEKLRESQERYTLATRAARVGVWDWNLETGEFYLDPNIKAILGYRDEEIPNDLDVWSTYVHPQDATRVMQAAQAHLEGKTPEYTCEHRMLHKDGSIRWVLVRGTVIRDEQGNAIRMVGTDSDITELKRTQEAFQKSEKRFRAVFEQAPLGIALVDSQTGRFKSLNQKYADIVGYSRKELAKLAFHDITHPDDLEANLQETQLMVDGKIDILGLEKRYMRQDGSVVWVNLTCVPLSWDEGDPRSHIAMIQDITERRRAQEELARSNNDLQHFAYIISHDLQEPLRLIKGYLRLLQQSFQDQLDEKANEFVHYSVDGATRMQRMVQALLEYSRIETRGHPLQKVDSEALLTQVTNDLELLINDHRAKITYDPLPVVLADPTQLVRVFQNLLTNSIKFQPQGPAHDHEPPRVHISAQQKGEEWVFAVRDNGIGIAPQQTDQIFQMFRRLHSPEEYPGTGIGLAICKKIITRHGGDIWVESEPGQGATFYFTLPVHPKIPPEPSPETDVSA
jgi:PAS domain S-box-containing protein